MNKYENQLDDAHKYVYSSTYTIWFQPIQFDGIIWYGRLILIYSTVSIAHTHRPQHGSFELYYQLDYHVYVCGALLKNPETPRTFAILLRLIGLFVEIETVIINPWFSYSYYMPLFSLKFDLHIENVYTFPSSNQISPQIYFKFSH